MTYYSINIDEEVYDFLESHVSFEQNTPNAVLRQLLFQDSPSVPKSNEEATIEESNTISLEPLSSYERLLPRALLHTLEVIELIKKGYSRNEATHRVAEKYNVHYQTIMDKYCRQLNLTAYDFDRLLKEDSSKNLQNILKEKFNSNNKQISDFFIYLNW